MKCPVFSKVFSDLKDRTIHYISQNSIPKQMKYDSSVLHDFFLHSKIFAAIVVQLSAATETRKIAHEEETRNGETEGQRN